MKKNIKDLSVGQIKNQIKSFLDGNLKKDNIQKIVKEALFTNEFYQCEGNQQKYFIPVNTFVSSQAGRFLVKETTEFFGFEVDLDNYNSDLQYYVNELDYILQIADNYINELIDIDGIDLYFNCNNGFNLQAVFYFDYIPGFYKNKNIASADVSLDISLTEYASLWKFKNGNVLYIHSFYDYDNNEIFYYDTFFTDFDDMVEFIKDNLEYTSLNVNIHRFLRNINNINDAFQEIYNILSQDISLIGCTIPKKADIPLEILNNELDYNLQEG